ncbi:CAP domain-containing protein [Massilia sp. CT11-108]|uniref:CAP domain-containing protein n=1 Tax=Massilia sp. CT11-108 TaxID=3393900 RepID=UPI0039A60F27
MPALTRLLLLAATLAAAAPARADELANLINAYRAAPGICDDAAAAPVAALNVEPTLSRIRIGPGTFLEFALQRAGYEAAHAEAITVTGPPDARAAMEAIAQKYCRTLRAAFTCGTQAFGPAGPLVWNPLLGQAALVHSTDMAQKHYFNHKQPDGSVPADRATQAGYRWARVGENIASGQRTPEEAVASWLDSPGHCANIMNPAFTEMGAAYAINPQNRNRTAYWTQVFGTPR